MYLMKDMVFFKKIPNIKFLNILNVLWPLYIINVFHFKNMVSKKLLGWTVNFSHGKDNK